MQYRKIVSAHFRSRPNRFIAKVDRNGEELTVHVKNTGRCAELLRPGCTVYLEKSSNPNRKTSYDLVAVEKANRLVNMDSAAPNQAAKEWLLAGGIGSLDFLKAEYSLGDSRFDFYAEQGNNRVLVEVKGCTFEENGFARFPDAPTERGLKHVKELTVLAQEGWMCYVLMVVQMKGIHTFVPNWATHPAFGTALQQAQKAGVHLLAYDCIVTPNSLKIDQPIPIDLTVPEQ